MEKSRELARLAVGVVVCLSGSVLAEPTKSAAAEITATKITINEALARAGQRATVEMAGAGVELARHEAEQAGRVAHNPELSAGVGPRWVGSERDLAVELGLAQTLELGGKRAARASAGQARVAAAEVERRAAELLARAEAWRTFQLALAARERLAMAQEAEQVALQIEGATRERQNVGFGTQLEVNLTTAEVGRARHDRLDAERKLGEAVRALASAIGAAARESLEPVGELAAPPALAGEVDALVAAALRGRPEGELARAAVRLAVAEVRVADAQGAPELTVGVNYGREREPDATTQTLLATASIALPLWNRNQSGRRAARAQARRAELEAQWTATEIEREVRTAASGYQRTREGFLGFDREVNERLHENLELARESYTSGKIDYFQFNVVRRELLASRNAYLDAFEETVEAWSAVQRSTGGAVKP